MCKMVVVLCHAPTPWLQKYPFYPAFYPWLIQSQLMSLGLSDSGGLLH
jgi:hypothetical protein